MSENLGYIGTGPAEEPRVLVLDSLQEHLWAVREARKTPEERVVESAVKTREDQAVDNKFAAWSLGNAVRASREVIN